MQCFRVISLPSGAMMAALPSDAVGPCRDGGIVYEVSNCPPEATVADALVLLYGLMPVRGIYRFDFAELRSRRSSCCGTCGN